MYNNDFENEQEEQEQKEGSFLTNFYNNNKVLVWIFCGIILFIIIMSLISRSGSGSKKEDLTYEISIYPEETITVSIGTSTNLTAAVKNNPQAEIVWTSADENVAKVDNGNVTGIGYGKTKITATYIHTDDKKYTADREVVVADGDPTIKLTDVSFKDGDLFMPLNSTYKIALSLTPSRGYIESKQFTSSNTSVVTVDNTGLVTAVGVGEAIISFDVNNGQFNKNLKVYVDSSYTKTEIIITPEKISFDGELRKIKVGTTEKLTYTTYPENVDRTKLTWESSDPTTVTVDDNGKIKGIKEGNAVITLSSINGTKDRIDIEVESDVIDVTDINLSLTDMYFTVGQSQTITPIVLPDNASNKALSYVSMDSTIAAVAPNETGTQATITAISVGSTTLVVKSTNGIEKRLNITVTGSGGQQDPTPTGGGYSGGNDTTIVVRSADNNLSKDYNDVINMYAQGPSNVTITLHDGVSKVKYCLIPYSGVDCTPNVEMNGTGSLIVPTGNIYLLCVKKFDNNGNEISSSSTNYSNGVLHYYINTKGNGATAAPVVGNLYSIGGKVYDTEAAAKLDSYTGSGTISFAVDSSVGYIKTCWSNTSTNCTPTRTITSADAATFSSPGLWTIRIQEVYNNGTTNTVKKYVYVKANGGSVTATPTPAPTATPVPTPTTAPTITPTPYVAPTCNAPTNVSVDADGIVTWRASSNAKSYEISIDNGVYKSATSGVNFKDTIIQTSGNKKVYVRSVCNGAVSSPATASVQVLKIELTSGDGISATSGSGNYIKGDTVTIDATVKDGYTWNRWTKYGGSEFSKTQKYTFTVTSSQTLTANAVSNTKSMANVRIVCGSGFSVGSVDKIYDGDYVLQKGVDYECVLESIEGMAIKNYICKGKGQYTGEKEVACYY